MPPASADSSPETPFTSSWIQALTKAADNPLARGIKPKLEWLDQLSLQRASQERQEAAEQLWAYADANSLLPLLHCLPVRSSPWRFDDDDRFIIHHPNPPAIETIEDWCAQLGIADGEYRVQTEVTASDWTSLVRSEAVRNQKPFSSSAFDGQTTMQIEGVARWLDGHWELGFDSIDWLTVSFDEPIQVPRPDWSALEDTVTWCLTECDLVKRAQKLGPTKSASGGLAWIDCIDSLQPMHDWVLSHQSGLGDWVKQAWCCVWPTVYREQNVLRGRADLVTIRDQMANCMTNASELTVWLFVFAKLVCLTQRGSGMGVCADYSAT